MIIGLHYEVIQPQLVFHNAQAYAMTPIKKLTLTRIVGEPKRLFSFLKTLVVGVSFLIGVMRFHDQTGFCPTLDFKHMPCFRLLILEVESP